MTAPLFDLDHIESLLRASAQAGETFSYSGLLNRLGLLFSRPKMRALCKVLDEIDRRAAMADQPELAVLVVRESDRLPGQGWWIGRTDYRGCWTGPEAADHIACLQRAAFSFWRNTSIEH
jgi:hypothetical protein